jgi:hypothetical protein
MSPSSCVRRRPIPTPSLDLCRRERWFPLPLLSAPAAGGRGASFLHLVVRVRVRLMWCIVWVVVAMPRRINLPHLYSHTSGDLHGGASEVIATCAVWSFISVFLPFSMCHWLPLAAEVRWFLWSEDVGWRWWISRPSPTSSMGGGSSLSKTAQGHPLVDVPQQHVTRCVHRACSSTHKASLAIMLSWIGNGGGSTFLLACVSAALELDAGRWLRWLQ